MRFTSDNPGLIQAIRYYKSPSETGTHVGHIWSSTGQPLATHHLHERRRIGLAAAGARHSADHQCRHDLRCLRQYQQLLRRHLAGLRLGISNGGLSAPVGAGVYNYNAGVFPSPVYQNENYFRDVVFTPGIGNFLAGQRDDLRQ